MGLEYTCFERIFRKARLPACFIVQRKSADLISAHTFHAWLIVALSPRLSFSPGKLNKTSHVTPVKMV